jgi:hypothetical protein
MRITEIEQFIHLRYEVLMAVKIPMLVFYSPECESSMFLRNVYIFLQASTA